MSTRVTVGGVVTSSHAGTITRLRSTHDGTAWARQLSVTAGSTSTVRHRQRAGNPSAALVMISTSLPSAVQSSTNRSSSAVAAPGSVARSSIARDAERPQRVAGQFDLVGGHGDDEREHQSGRLESRSPCIALS